MKTRHAPRLALALLERLVPDGEPLAGDLLEEFERRPSAAWFWVQVLAAIATAHRVRPVEIRPLQLVDLQPVDAVERWRQMSLRFPRANLSGSPVAGVGGIGLATLAWLMTRVEPTAWWVLLASAGAGCALGAIMIIVRAAADTRRGEG